MNVGFDSYGPVAISIPATSIKNFRIVFSKATPNFDIAELQVSSSPAVESFTEKTLAKVFQTPLPYWNEYQWLVQPVVENESLMIDPKTVIDIS